MSTAPPRARSPSPLLQPWSAVVACAAASVLALAADEENQTELREEEGEIMSVAYDLRLEPLGVQSGLPPRWPHAILDLDADQRTYEWSAQTVLLNAPGTTFNPQRSPLREEHDVLTAEVRQALWTPFPWDAELEIEAALDRRTATSGGATVQGATLLTADPCVELLLPLWQERYAGVLIGGGVSLPSGDTQDWLEAHDALGYLACARWSGVVPGVSWMTFSTSAKYHWADRCTQTIYPATPALEVHCGYQGWQLGAATTVRLSRRVAMGVALDYEHHRFTDIVVPGVGAGVDRDGVGDALAPPSLLMLPERWFWMLTVTRSQGLDGWIGHGVSLGAQVALAAW